MSTKVTVTKPTGEYNAEEYKKPWIGRVKISPFNKYEGVDFDTFPRGRFVGEEGQAGQLTIEVPAGTSLAFGQALKEEGKKGKVKYAIAGEDGSLSEVDRDAAVENAIKQRAAGLSGDADRLRGAALVASVIRNYALSPEEYSEANVAAQKKALSDTAKAAQTAKQEAAADPAPGV